MTLEAWMIANSKSVDEVAAAVGVTGRAIRHYLRGDRRPEWTIIKRISEVTSNSVTANDWLEKKIHSAA